MLYRIAQLLFDITAMMEERTALTKEKMFGFSKSLLSSQIPQHISERILRQWPRKIPTFCIPTLPSGMFHHHQTLQRNRSAVVTIHKIEDSLEPNSVRRMVVDTLDSIRSCLSAHYVLTQCFSRMYRMALMLQKYSLCGTV